MGLPTCVLFIGGEGRSGSTVLERLLAAQPETCAVGELKNLFERVWRMANCAGAERASVTARSGRRSADGSSGDGTPPPAANSSPSSRGSTAEPNCR